ncbi:MAG: HIT domain-containing protein [Nanoarchaeota archaeon]
MAEQQMTPEQVDELKEKLKDMSPEEIKEFQKKQCIFCHIVAGKVQSKKIYEDDKCLGILDINPANPGHILLMTKEHYSIMPQIPEDVLQHIFMVAKALSNACLRGLGVGGTNIFVANGVAAGQKANHFMVHIIPRKEKDGIKFELPQKKISEEELITIRNKLTKKIASLTGKGEVMRTERPEKNVLEAVFEEESEDDEIDEKKGEIAEEREVEEKEDLVEDRKALEEPEEKPLKKTAKEPIKKKEPKEKPKGDVSLDDISDLFK